MARKLRSSEKLATTATDYLKGHTGLSVKRSIESSDTEDDGVQAPKRAKLRTRTDFSKWRLLSDHGRQTWEYLEDDEAAKAWPQTIADKWHLGMETVNQITPSLLSSGHYKWGCY